jgi:hypothetical protein
LRCHRGHVRRHGKEDAGGRGAGAGRRYVEHDRHLRGELGLDDLSHRRVEPARSVCEDDHGGIVLVVRAVDGVGQVLLRDRVDIILELDRQHALLVARLGLGKGYSRREP